VISSGWTPSHIHSKCLRTSLSCPIHGTSSKNSSSTDYISRWCLVELSPSILCATTFINTCQPTFPHKDIRLTITRIDPLMNTSALFKHTYGGTCITFYCWERPGVLFYYIYSLFKGSGCALIFFLFFLPLKGREVEVNVFFPLHLTCGKGFFLLLLLLFSLLSG